VELDFSRLQVSLCLFYFQSTFFFRFGMGFNCLKANISKLASVGCGFAEYINPSRPFSTQVIMQINRAKQPSLSSVSVAWGNRDKAKQSLQSPSLIRSLFHDERLTVSKDFFFSYMMDFFSDFFFC
jgi:hypothetical protein